MLTADQMEQLKQRLLSDRDRLIYNAEKAKGFSRDRDRDNVGRDSIDESVAEAMYSTELRLHDREKFLLGKIQSALERLENGEIDVCEDCEEPIGYKRLEARPVTTLCILCKEERESNE